MTEELKYSGIYERLVSDDHDFLGQVAYSIYKKRKREFIVRKQSELGVNTVPDSVVAEFVKSQSDYTLDLYRTQAYNLSIEFLNESYTDTLTEMLQDLNKEYKEKYEELARNIKPHSWWYGVWQSFAASFFFLLAGFIALKMSGSWDILLKNLFG